MRVCMCVCVRICDTCVRCACVCTVSVSLPLPLFLCRCLCVELVALPSLRLGVAYAPRPRFSLTPQPRASRQCFLLVLCVVPSPFPATICVRREATCFLPDAHQGSFDSPICLPTCVHYLCVPCIIYLYTVCWSMFLLICLAGRCFVCFIFLFFSHCCVFFYLFTLLIIYTCRT